MDPEQRDAFGIIVSYTVKVKLYLGALNGELAAELPFILMHPKVHRSNPFLRVRAIFHFGNCIIIFFRVMFYDSVQYTSSGLTAM